MTNLLIKSLIITLLTVFSSSGDYGIYNHEVDFAVADTVKILPTLDTIACVEVKPKKIVYPFKGDLGVFMNCVAEGESGGNLAVINRYGYMGKYQFNRRTLDGIGYSHISDSAFLACEQLQDTAMLLLLKYNQRILHNYIDSFDGVVRDSITLTKSGLLAGAHLVGAGGVMSYLNGDSTYRTSDGNGVHVSVYVEQFGSYELNL